MKKITDPGPQARSEPNPCKGVCLSLLFASIVIELCLLYPGAIFHRALLTSAPLAYGMKAWKGQLPETDTPLLGNPTLSDDMIMFAPWDKLIRESFASHHPPLLNPANGCGMPLLANNQSAVLAPTHALRVIWNSPRARTLGLLLKPFLAGVGVFLLLLQWRRSPIAALIGALAWANAACFTVWLIYPISEVLAWFSWVVLGLAQILGVGDRRPRAGFFVLTVSLAAMLLSGHLPTVAQLGAVTGIGVIVIALLRRSTRPHLPLAAIAVFTGTLLAAPQILPTLAYIGQSQAGLLRGGANPAATLHLPLQAAWSWVVPRGFGSPQMDGYRGPVNFNEATASVGILILLMAALALCYRPGLKELSLASLAVFSAAIAYGLPPLANIVALTPILKLASGIRFITLTQWSFALLAAFFYDKRADFPRRRLLFASAALGIPTLVAITLHPTLSTAFDPSAVLSARWILASSAITIICIVLFAIPRLRGFGRAVPVALILLVGCEGMLLSRGFNVENPPSSLPNRTPALNTVQAVNRGSRIMPIGWTMQPNTNLFAGLAAVNGYDDLIPQRLSLFAKFAHFDALNTTSTIGKDSIALLSRAGAGVLLSDRPVSGPALGAIASIQGPLLWAYSIPRPAPFIAWYSQAVTVPNSARAFSLLGSEAIDSNTITVETAESLPSNLPAVVHAYSSTASSSDTLSVSCSQNQPGWLLFRVAFDPGWQARTDRQSSRVFVADGMFMAVFVPSGSHTVELVYSPLSWRLGLVLAGCGLLILLVRGITTTLHTRNKQSPI